MKKNYFKLFAGAAGLLLSTGLKAQTYTHGDITAVVMPTMSHDSTWCHSTCNTGYMMTITGSFTGDSVKIVDMSSSMLLAAYGNSSGASTWSFFAPVPIYNPVVSDDLVSGGGVNFVGPTIKIICDTDTITSIPNIHFLPVLNPCLYGDVSGKVYIDNNNDCVFNTGDVALNSIIVTANAALSSPSTSSDVRNTYSNATGAYGMLVQQSWMTSYTMTMPPDYLFIFPVSPCFSGSYTYTILPQVNVDFPLHCSGAIDVQCWAGSPAAVRPGAAFNMSPFVNNIGCDSASGVLTFVKDHRVTYNAGLSAYPASSVSGDTLRWNYTNLTNLTGGAYWNSLTGGVHLTPDATVHAGDTLCFRVYTSIAPTDIDVTNNDYMICLPVVYSYDPNVKEVSPKGIGAPGYITATDDTLIYTIHFQNTGTAAAYDVTVVDSLDGDIAANSLRILGSSFAMSPEWVSPGVIKFKFNGIYLPDSASNEPGSHGFVRFKVKLNTGLVPGTQIKNKAYIYFDANPAVITNTALNTIAAAPPVTGIAVTGAGNMRVYPNPATDQIFAENLKGGRLSVQSMNGVVLIDMSISDMQTAIDVSKLPVGVYLLKTVSENETTVSKFIKR